MCIQPHEVLPQATTNIPLCMIVQDNLQAADEGVELAQLESNQRLRIATAQSKEALRKSANEATILRIKLNRCNEGLRHVQSEAAKLKQERDQLRQDLTVQLSGLQTWCSEILKHSMEHMQQQQLQEPTRTTQPTAGVSSDLAAMRNLAIRCAVSVNSNRKRKLLQHAIYLSIC